MSDLKFYYQKDSTVHNITVQRSNTVSQYSAGDEMQFMVDWTEKEEYTEQVQAVGLYGIQLPKTFLEH